MKILAAVLALISTATVSAQEYTFKVLINKGQNQVRTGDDWTPIMVGANLKSGDELKISKNGYLGLVHRTGKPLEVKEPGQHTVVGLAAKIREGSSVLNKYTDFILSTITPKDNNLTATGSVYRGTRMIKLLLPKEQSAIVYNDEVTVAWEKDDSTKTYVVRFNSMFGDVLDRIELKDTTMTIHLDGSKLSNEDNILVQVSSKEDEQKESETFMLKRVSPADRIRINTAMSEIAAQIREKTALNQLYLAAFYENSGLFIDASTAYVNAIKLAANVPEYREAFGQFLLRNGSKK